MNIFMQFQCQAKLQGVNRLQDEKARLAVEISDYERKIMVLIYFIGTYAFICCTSGRKVSNELTLFGTRKRKVKSSR